ncbi:hypothetical protein B0O80DRAFT_62694 [Mortierella sp. GBAus27b]|nr:hypothetical protein B0O80DRAFT_62694 [Mortierella sp. GBAus27b]
MDYQVDTSKIDYDYVTLSSSLSLSSSSPPTEAMSSPVAPRCKPTLSALPPELLSRIASNLSLYEYSILSRTCSHLHRHLFHPSELVFFLKTRYRLSIESGSIIIFAYLVNMQVRCPVLLERIFEDFFADSPQMRLEEEQQKQQRQQQRQLLNQNTFQLSQAIMNHHSVGNRDVGISIQCMDSLQSHHYAEKARRQAKWDLVRMLSVLYALDKTHTGPSSSTNALSLSGAKDAVEQPQPPAGLPMNTSESVSLLSCDSLSSSSSAPVVSSTLPDNYYNAGSECQDQGSPSIDKRHRRGRTLSRQDPQEQRAMRSLHKRHSSLYEARTLEMYGSVNTSMASNLDSQDSRTPSFRQHAATPPSTGSSRGHHSASPSLSPKQPGIRKPFKARRKRLGVSLRHTERQGKDTAVTKDEDIMDHQHDQPHEQWFNDEHGDLTSPSMEEYTMDTGDAFGQFNMDPDGDDVVGSKGSIPDRHSFKAASISPLTNTPRNNEAQGIVERSTPANRRNHDSVNTRNSADGSCTDYTDLTPPMAMLERVCDAVPQHKQHQRILTRSDKIAFLTKYTDRMHRKLRELGIENWGQEDIQRKKTYRMMIQNNDKTGEKSLLEFYLGRYGGAVQHLDERQEQQNPNQSHSH